MGCDGGTIPTRDELVKTKKKPEQKDQDSVRLYKWQHCALTQEPLDKPIVACELGRLYNKEAIIEKLLNAKSEGSSQGADHIKSLKDVKELQLEPNPNFKDKASVGDGGYVDRSISPWICPLTSQEMNGKFRFVFDWSNGKVMSKRAYKMLKADKAAAIAEEDLIVINPDENSDDEDLMRTKMEARRARIKAAKKAAKEEKRKANGSATVANDEVSDAKKAKVVQQPSTSSSSKMIKNGSDKTKATKSVQDDPTKTEVYKSLFSSHKTALNKPKGNWVTFDPRYN